MNRCIAPYVTELPVFFLTQMPGNLVDGHYIPAGSICGLRKTPEEWTHFVRNIAEHGILNPLSIVAGARDGRVRLAEGNHRLRAAIELRWDTVPAYVWVQDTNAHGWKMPLRSELLRYAMVTETYDSIVGPQLVNPTALFQESL